MDELRARHPGLEIESCAGGGGRIDLEILDRTDRVWPSDCIDALERQQIQRYTQLLLPPELVGTHLGDAEAHTTRRRHHIGFRGATAIWGHMGIEWDLTSTTPGERDQVRRWVELHKSLRPLLHSGDVVVGDHPDPAIWVNGVVAQDKSEAVFGITTVGRPVTFPPGRVCLPGLRPAHPVRAGTRSRPPTTTPEQTSTRGGGTDGVHAVRPHAGRGRRADPGDVPRVHPHRSRPRSPGPSRQPQRHDAVGAGHEGVSANDSDRPDIRVEAAT